METGLLVAATSCCSKSDPLCWKYGDLNTKSIRSTVSLGVSMIDAGVQVRGRSRTSVLRLVGLPQLERW